MTIDFLGAAGGVTGSMHLITTDQGHRILLDCGLHQGRRAEAWRLNSELPFAPSTLDAVVLSHAHIDHSGNLPSLVSGRRRERYRGAIHATEATRDLCSIMLPDSARIQESDAEFLRRKGMHPFDPIYQEEDALRVLERFEDIAYNQSRQITDDVRLTVIDAGHILGSAQVILDIDRADGSTTRLGFTGDLGRVNRPILRDPVPMGDVDFLISESTYGGRVHPPYPDLQRTLAEIIDRVAGRGGRILIPAFAVGRTQDIVYLLNDLFEQGELPRIPMYVDSPLAVSATDIFRRHPECFNKRVLDLMESDPDPFGFSGLHFITDVEASKQLNEMRQPCVIISASGMMEGGRVVHHLAHAVEEERNLILIPGFQAEHTLGRRVVERREFLTMLGRQFRLRAEVVTVNGLSAHAGGDELVAAIGAMSRERMQRIFLVHGEPSAAEALRADLRGVGFQQVVIPQRGDRVELW